MTASPIEVFVCAGEASSDAHAAGLVRELQKILPQAHFFGMGGRELRAAGVETLIDSETAASVMGLVEVVGSLPKLIRAMNRLVEECNARRPALAVLVDFPDFNLTIAKRLRRRGVKVFYFVAPQLWAWRKGRVRTIAQNVRRVAAIFPFEEEFYHRHGIEARYVGHPFTDLPRLRPAEEIRADLGLDAQSVVIGLLPGSRHSEITRLLEPMARGFQRLKQELPGIRAVVPVAPTVDEADLRRQIAGIEDFCFYRGPAREVLALAEASVVASGTATVEAALAGKPFIVVYKLAPITYRIARVIVRGVKFFAMPNLIAGRRVVPELLQSEVTGERIAEELRSLVCDLDLREKMQGDLKQVAGALARRTEQGESTAYRNAALYAAELATDQ